MTPDQLATISRLADDGDPFFRGARWILDQLETTDTATEQSRTP